MDSTSDHDHDHQELLKAQAHIWNHTFNFINSMSLKCAIELSIPETIHGHGSAMTLPELVAKLPIHPSKTTHLHRLMRALTHSGFFELQEIGQDQQGYVLTRSSRLLLKENPMSVAPFALAMLDSCVTAPWQRMGGWFRSGGEATAFEAEHGVAAWEYAGREAGYGGLFNEAMASDARLVRSVVIDECGGVFEGVRTLVDVGGGIGTMAKGLVEAFPGLECTVLDLPRVVEGLEGGKNLRFVGGDMFEAVPPANAVLLKWILHDWNDEECVKILKNCKEAITSDVKGGKVIIIDMVVGEKNKDKDTIETQLLFDLLMMSFVSGRERDEKEWAHLFSEAGFTDFKITPILGLRSLIEVYP